MGIPLRPKHAVNIKGKGVMGQVLGVKSWGLGVGLDKSKQDETRQVKKMSRQDKTRQGKTRQDKTKPILNQTKQALLSSVLSGPNPYLDFVRSNFKLDCSP